MQQKPERTNKHSGKHDVVHVPLAQMLSTAAGAGISKRGVPDARSKKEASKQADGSGLPTDFSMDFGMLPPSKPLRTVSTRPNAVATKPDTALPRVHAGQGQASTQVMRNSSQVGAHAPTARKPASLVPDARPSKPGSRLNMMQGSQRSGSLNTQKPSVAERGATKHSRDSDAAGKPVRHSYTFETDLAFLNHLGLNVGSSPSAAL